MQTLEKALANLVKNNTITKTEALSKASKEGELDRLISSP